jgi:hypothetical protein
MMHLTMRILISHLVLSIMLILQLVVHLITIFLSTITAITLTLILTLNLHTINNMKQITTVKLKIITKSAVTMKKMKILVINKMKKTINQLNLNHSKNQWMILLMKINLKKNKRSIIIQSKVKITYCFSKIKKIE